jgi:membrane associated rhomboid family serine protease
MTEEPLVLAGVYGSLTRAACDERAFVLNAVGIASVIESDGFNFRLAVRAGDLPAATAHLRAYDDERRAARAARVPAPAARVHAIPWLGTVFYVLVLLGVARAISGGMWPPQAFDNGVLDAAAVRSGQWWRAWTALTLHWDGAHLMANLGGGLWFGTLAARQLGNGWAWLMIVTAAAAANLFDAHLGPAWYHSAGASTAVFAALGLMAAHGWRARYYLPQRPVLRWAPLVAGVILLGWFGSAGEGTDLVAHAMGFTLGAVLGAAAAVPAVDALLTRVPQWISGTLALASLAVAWTLALLH